MRILPLLLISAISIAGPGFAEGIKIIGKGSIKPSEKAPAQAPAAEAPAAEAPAAEAPADPVTEGTAGNVAETTAPDGIVTASDPKSIVAALQEYGVAAKLEADDDGDPVIRLKISGANSNIYFYGCDDNHADCRSIAFSAGFDLNEPYTPEKANEWNNNKRFSKSYVSEDGSAQIEMDVNMIGGITTDGFADTIDWWDYSLGEYKTFIGW